MEIPQETALKSALHHLKEENMVGLGVELYYFVVYSLMF